MGDLDAWGDIGRRYEIHEETLSYFRKVAMLGGKPLAEWNPEPEQLRALSLRVNEVAGGAVVDFDGSEKEILVPATGGRSNAVVPVSVYKPHNLGRVPSILVYFHGGGLVTGSRNGYISTLKLLATRARCIVVNVEYRLAPEHKAPAAFDDCRDVTNWAKQNRVLLGGDQVSPVGVGGDSAGGQLASSIAHDVEGLSFQILVYPHTDLTLSTPSHAEFESTPGLNLKSVRWFTANYLESEAQKTDPVVSPYHRPSFTGLPPALCILAELDPLRDDGLAYCDKLKEAGVATELFVIKGAPHGYFNKPAHFKELTKESYDRIVRFLTQFQPQ